MRTISVIKYSEDRTFAVVRNPIFLRIPRTSSMATAKISDSLIDETIRIARSCEMTLVSDQGICIPDVFYAVRVADIEAAGCSHELSRAPTLPPPMKPQPRRDQPRIAEDVEYRISRGLEGTMTTEESAAWSYMVRIRLQDREEESRARERANNPCQGTMPCDLDFDI